MTISDLGRDHISSIRSEVAKFLIANSGIKDVDFESDIRAAGINSLALVELVYCLEQKYDVTLDETELYAVDSLKYLVTLIANKVR